MWEETINTVFDCHMTIMAMCLIAVFIKSKSILAALSNTACRDINALSHPTQVIVQNVSQMSCNMKLCESYSQGRDYKKGVNRLVSGEITAHKIPWDQFRILFSTCNNKTL